MCAHPITARAKSPHLATLFSCSGKHPRNRTVGTQKRRPSTVDPRPSTVDHGLYYRRPSFCPSINSINKKTICYYSQVEMSYHSVYTCETQIARKLYFSQRPTFINYSKLIKTKTTSAISITFSTNSLNIFSIVGL